MIMFKNLGNMADLFKQAQEMQKKMAHSLNSTENLICFSDDDDVAP